MTHVAADAAEEATAAEPVSVAHPPAAAHVRVGRRQLLRQRLRVPVPGAQWRAQPRRPRGGRISSVIDITFGELISFQIEVCKYIYFIEQIRFDRIFFGKSSLYLLTFSILYS